MNDALAFSSGDAKWTALREQCKDLFFFATTVLGYGTLFPCLPETHLLYCRFVQRKTGIPDIDNAPWQMCMTPRGTGKSALGTIAASIQMACFNPDTSIMIANEKAQLAEDFLSSIKGHFSTNELLRALFPEVCPNEEDLKKLTWKTDAATVKRTSNRPEPTFFTIGVGGTRIGMHPDGIIIDDPISKEAMENARVGAWQIMDRVNRWHDEQKLLLNTQAKPFPWVRVNGTVWWKDDTYAYIEKQYGYGEDPRHYRLTAKMPDGSMVSRDVYRVGDVAIFRAAAIEDGRAMYPLIHPMESLVKLQRDNPELFSCNMLQNPTDKSIRTFQDDWLRYYEKLDPKTLGFKQDDGTMRYVSTDDLSKIMIVDPAFTANGQGARAAIVVVGSDFDSGKRIVLEAVAERAEPKELCDDVLNLAKRRGVTRVFIEAIAQQLGWIAFVQQRALDRGLPIAIETVKPGGRNKDVRIEGLAAPFQAGQILIHPSHLDLIREYRDYRPGARYKDLLDALAYGPELWPSLPGKGRSTGAGSARLQRELASYYSRRGVVQPSEQPFESFE